MKKKMFIVAFLLTLALALPLMACNAKPSGKYIADEYKVEFTDGKVAQGKFSDIENDENLGILKIQVGLMSAMYFEFNGDEVTIGYETGIGSGLTQKTFDFTMDGKNVIISDPDATSEQMGSIKLKGSKLVMENTEQDIKMTFTFKKA